MAVAFRRVVSVRICPALAGYFFPTYVAHHAPTVSWNAVLIHLAAEGFQFGKEVIFTYGPFSHL